MLHTIKYCGDLLQQKKYNSNIFYGPLTMNIYNIHNIYIYNSEFLICWYGASLAQRASYLALHSSLFGPDGTVNYDCIVINSLLIGLRCIPSGAHTNHASKCIKNYDIIIHTCMLGSYTYSICNLIKLHHSGNSWPGIKRNECSSYTHWSK